MTEQKHILNLTPQIIPLSSLHVSELTAAETRCYRRPWSTEQIRIELLQESAFHFGAFCEEQLVGYSLNHLVRDELHVLNIAVCPEHRVCGIATKLFSHVLTEAVNRGAQISSLEVRRSNVIAQKLYANAGFVVVGTRTAYYADTGEDALLCCCALTEKYGTFAKAIG